MPQQCVLVIFQQQEQKQNAPICCTTSYSMVTKSSNVLCSVDHCGHCIQKIKTKKQILISVRVPTCFSSIQHSTEQQKTVPSSTRPLTCQCCFPIHSSWTTTQERSVHKKNNCTAALPADWGWLPNACCSPGSILANTSTYWSRQSGSN